MMIYKIKKLLVIFLLLLSSCVETKKNIISSPSIQSNSKLENSVVSSVIVSINPSPSHIAKIRPKVDEENSILILIDTHLLVDKFKVFMNTEEVNKYPRKVYVLKESYDNLDQTDLEKLNKEYPEYKIYDPSKDNLDMKNSEGDLGYKEDEKPTCISYYSYYSKFRGSRINFGFLYGNLIRVQYPSEKEMIGIVNKFHAFFDDYPKFYNITKEKYEKTSIDPPEYSINVSVKNVDLKDLYKYIYNYNKNKKYDNKVREIKVSSLRGAKYQTIKYALLSNYNLLVEESGDYDERDLLFSLKEGDTGFKFYSKIECDKLSAKNYEDRVKSLKEVNPDYIYAPPPNYDDL